ncbi:MAG: hypothetical protein H0W65_09530 [Sphingomonas sp.]|uniref:hypothetical protein n=1 Tax=Sphingomonas sp. TaxID=28214 RepID=UPI0017BFA90B|nr:hypothetical protein [Sphingomonas sp.]MBA3667949.1 hypothetical protein [Sphingomonas sp.]
MATQLLTPPPAPAATTFALSGPGGTLALDRRTIETLAEFFVGALDCSQADADLEHNGDELDGTGGEDDFVDHPNHFGPGCPISDPDAAVDDSPCDACSEDGL